MKIKARILILFAFMFAIIISCASCGKSSIAKKTNALGGTGDVKNLNYIEGLGGVYDNDNVYVLAMVYPLTMNYSYIKVTKDNEAYVNCDLATCKHNDSTCHASAIYQYFEFNGNLYRYGHSDIKVGNTKKVVFENRIPEDVKDLDADTLIDRVYLIDENYAIVRSSRYGYLVDNKFNIIYTFTDEGNFRWGKVYNNSFYYVNDLGEMMSVDIATGQRKPLDLGEKIYSADDDGDWIFFSTLNNKLFKVSLKTGEKVLLKEHIFPAFMVQSGYIYYQENGFPGCHKEIWDYDGKLIKDCTENTNMELFTACVANGKLYSVTYIGDTVGKVCISVMNADGTDYHEIMLE